MYSRLFFGLDGLDRYEERRLSVCYSLPPSFNSFCLSLPTSNEWSNLRPFLDQILLKYFLPHTEPSIVISCIMTDKLSISSRSSILPLKLATPPTLPTKRCLLEAAFWLTAIRPRVLDQCQKKQPSPRHFKLTTIHRILNCPCSTNFIRSPNPTPITRLMSSCSTLSI